MRRISPVIMVLAGVFIFLFSYIEFDKMIFRSFSSQTYSDEAFHLGVSGKLSDEETQEFRAAFILLLDKYELNCYQRFTFNQDHYLWVYSKDERFFESIPLSNGSLSSINPGDCYFSNDGAVKGNIYNPIRNKNYWIYHLDDFSCRYKSIYYPYELYSDDENRFEIYAAFVNDLKAAFPMLSVSSIQFELHQADQEQINAEMLAFVSLTAAIAVTNHNAILARKTKRFQLMKLEGYSSMRIFRANVLI